MLLVYVFSFLSVVSCQLSVVSYRLSVIGYQASDILKVILIMSTCPYSLFLILCSLFFIHSLSIIIFPYCRLSVN